MQSPVATVNGSPITRFEVENTIQEYSLQLHDKTMDELLEAELAEMKKVAMEKLVVWELIYQGGKVEISEKEVDEEMEELLGEFSSAEEFFESLGQAGVDEKAFRRYLRKDLAVSRTTERMIEEAKEPSGEQIEEEYGKYLDHEAPEPKARARHILVKVDAGAKEEERAAALERIRAIKKTEGDFAELAPEHSECASAAEGGDLGFFGRGAMVPSFEEAAFSQEVGVVGEVVESSFGYHLIKVEERNDETKMTLEQATPKIREVLREQAGVERLREWTARLKSEAVIEILEEGEAKG